MVIKKNAEAVSEQSPEKGKTLIYIGGHARYEDSTQVMSQSQISVYESTLKREVKEELGISIALNNVKPYWIYSAEHDKSKRHIAICFVVEQDIRNINLRLDSKELVMKKGTSKSGTFQSIEDIKKENLEAWSKKILEHSFGIKTNHQMSLFD